jgi:hypothetical protein
VPLAPWLALFGANAAYAPPLPASNAGLSGIGGSLNGSLSGGSLNGSLSGGGGLRAASGEAPLRLDGTRPLSSVDLVALLRAAGQDVSFSSSAAAVAVAAAAAESAGSGSAPYPHHHLLHPQHQLQQQQQQQQLPQQYDAVVDAHGHVKFMPRLLTSSVGGGNQSMGGGSNRGGGGGGGSGLSRHPLNHLAAAAAHAGPLSPHHAYAHVTNTAVTLLKLERLEARFESFLAGAQHVPPPSPSLNGRGRSPRPNQGQR